MPGTDVTKYCAPSWCMANGTQLHPIGLIDEAWYRCAPSLTTWNLANGSVLKRQVNHRKIDGQNGYRQIAHIDVPERIGKLRPHVIRMQPLIFDSPRHSNVTTGATGNVGGRSKNLSQNRRRRLEVNELAPFFDMQHMARGGPAPERIAMWKPASTAPGRADRIISHQRRDGHVRSFLHSLQLRRTKNIADDHKAIPM